MKNLWIFDGSLDIKSSLDINIYKYPLFLFFLFLFHGHTGLQGRLVTRI